MPSTCTDCDTLCALVLHHDPKFFLEMDFWVITEFEVDVLHGEKIVRSPARRGKTQVRNFPPHSAAEHADSCLHIRVAAPALVTPRRHAEQITRKMNFAIQRGHEKTPVWRKRAAK